MTEEVGEVEAAPTARPDAALPAPEAWETPPARKRPAWADPYFAAGVGVGLLLLYLLATRGGCAECAKAKAAAKAGQPEPVEVMPGYRAAEADVADEQRQSWAGCDVVDWCAGPRGHEGDHVRLRPLEPDEAYTVEDAAADLANA
jgi:hypothetical protein